MMWWAGGNTWFALGSAKQYGRGLSGAMAFAGRFQEYHDAHALADEPQAVRRLKVVPS